MVSTTDWRAGKPTSSSATITSIFQSGEEERFGRKSRDRSAHDYRLVLSPEKDLHMADKPYVIAEFVSASGKPMARLTGKIGESITFDLSNPHDIKVLAEIENGMKYDELQERKDDAHRDWNFERSMRKFANAPEKFQVAPEESFADMRYSPEAVMFSASRSEILTERVRDIILTAVPENLRDYFFAFYGEGLNNSEIARRDGVSETARRKYQKRLMTIVRDEYIARYGAFEPL